MNRTKPVGVWVRRGLLICTLFGVVGTCLATPPIKHNHKIGTVRKSGTKNRENARLDAIWTGVENELTAQNDAWFKVGDYPAVINSLRFLNSEDPTDYDYATSLGWMLENVTQYDEALAVYVRYRKFNSKEADAAFPEANFYFMRKVYARVPPLLVTTLDAKPHPNSYRLLAHSYEKLGLYPDAVKVWKRLIADYPSDKVAPVNEKKDELKIQKQSPVGA
jgi:tetratricopeptide (TPR) repeat protein